MLMFIIVVYMNHVYKYTPGRNLCYGRLDDHIKVYCPFYYSFQRHRVGSHFYVH